MRVLLLAISLLVVGCAAHHPKVDPPVRVRVSRCTFLATGTACDPKTMLPETFCVCTREL